MLSEISLPEEDAYRHLKQSKTSQTCRHKTDGIRNRRKEVKRYKLPMTKYVSHEVPYTERRLQLRILYCIFAVAELIIIRKKNCNDVRLVMLVMWTGFAVVIITQYVQAQNHCYTPKIHVTRERCQLKVYICIYKGMGENVMDTQLNINSN